MFSIPAIWGAIKLWQGWKRLSSLWRWITASPARIWAALAVLGLALAAWQHHRAIEAALATQRAQTTLATERAAAIAAKAQAETHYRNLAHDADANHDAVLAQGDARLAAYIAAHRLRAAPAAHSASATQDHGSAVPAGPATGPVVATIGISEADLKICDADYAYAQAAHDWAVSLAR